MTPVFSCRRLSGILSGARSRTGAARCVGLREISEESLAADVRAGRGPG